VQIWLFATPVAYSGSLVPERWRLVYGLNPMVGVVDGFRWMIAPAAPFPAAELGAGALALVLVLVTGLFVFRRMEQTFADVV
jgi:lipopolysaccharide transport system permease protein